MRKHVKFNLLTKNLLLDNILIEAADTEEEDAILRTPQQYGDKPEIGIVLAVGPGRLTDDGTRLPITVSAGMLVLFNKYLATKFRIDGNDYYVVREDDIVAYGKED